MAEGNGKSHILSSSELALSIEAQELVNTVVIEDEVVSLYCGDTLVSVMSETEWFEIKNVLFHIAGLDHD